MLDRPPFRLRIELSPEAARALVALAIRENRTADRQAAQLIAEALRAAGLLADGADRPGPAR